VFPEWNGELLIGSLLRRGVVRLRLAGNRIVGEETMLQEIGERVRDVRSDRWGYLYVLTDSLNGKILRIAPAPP
jgi:glucose/arabinose dehydrogenase